MRETAESLDRHLSTLDKALKEASSDMSARGKRWWTDWPKSLEMKNMCVTSWP